MQSTLDSANELDGAVRKQAYSSRAAALHGSSASSPSLLHDDIRTVTGLTSKQRAYLLKAGFTTSTEVLFTPIAALSERFKLSTYECQDIFDTIARHRFKHNTTIQSTSETRCFHSQSVADQLGLLNASTITVKPNRFLPTGDAGLDLVLGGGVVRGALTEFSGEAASGKTALCLQLAVQVQLSPAQGGLAGSCAYLCSEGNFPSVRLCQIAEARLATDTGTRVDTGRLKAITDNVHLIHCSEVDTLQYAVKYALPALVERLEQSHSVLDVANTAASSKPVRLIVIDSIAAPFRGAEAPDSEERTGDTSGPSERNDSGTNGQPTRHIFADRTRDLTNIASGLLRLAQRHNIAVVIINQVSDVFLRHTYQYQQAQNREDRELDQPSCTTEADRTGLPLEYRHYSYASRFFSGEAAGAHHRARAEARKMAVFGLSWTNCINARVMLSRTGRRKRRADGAELSEVQVLEQEQLEDQAAMHAVSNNPSEGNRGTLVHSHTEEVRRADVVFSPFSELGRIDYVFRQSGLVSVGKYLRLPRLPKGVKLDHRKRKRNADEIDDATQADGMWSQTSDYSMTAFNDGVGGCADSPSKQAACKGGSAAIPENEGMPISADDNEAALWEEFGSDDAIVENLQTHDSQGYTQVVPETQPG